MAGLLFLLAIIAAGASLLFKNAAGQVFVGTDWAVAVCSTSHLFCQHPEYLAYGAGGLLVLAIGFKLGSLAH
ncbi:MAG: hypothetical protein HY852_06450 [Bradyrhizobium sp.]|uniref:hypothetical protein n=1 Tax=Bradyrhizobium sp. TaxID=376 RepID=UPI0025BE9535|nr:hypothetical protein [Bradyrhizobium sp.]MBI5261442.1 hypothetical protein [Bradyrhizobium sp.]